MIRLQVQLLSKSDDFLWGIVLLTESVWKGPCQDYIQGKHCVFMDTENSWNQTDHNLLAFQVIYAAMKTINLNQKMTLNVGL